MLGRFGESTGYPATGVTVVQPKDVQAVSDKDLLVFASGDNQPLLQQWANRLPRRLSKGRATVSICPT